MRKLDSFLYCVSDNYRETTLYHNSLHGVDVAHNLCNFFINSNIEEVCESTVLDILGVIISAIGHDLGHPGYTNTYHINAANDLALTFNDKSCLENYHTSLLFRILKKMKIIYLKNLIRKISKLSETKDKTFFSKINIEFKSFSLKRTIIRLT